MVFVIIFIIMKQQADNVVDYNKIQKKEYAEICDKLKAEIEEVLSNSTSKIYHGSPVWFIDDNPILGYYATAESVNLLFWSGQSFDESGLTPTGKNKAALVKYQKLEDIDIPLLKRWLKKSKEIMWDYKNIVANKGKLNLIKK